MMKRMRLLLIVAPLTALLIGLGAWAISLCHQIQLLETRIAMLEADDHLMRDRSEVGVPFDVDEAMQMNQLRVRR